MSQGMESEGNERKQIGARVNADLWESFIEFAEEKNGKKGMASHELEHAIEMYMDSEREEGEKDELGEEFDLLNAKLDSIMVQVNQS